MSPRSETHKVVFEGEGDEVVRLVKALSREIKGLKATTRGASRSSAQLGRAFRNIALRAVGIVAGVRAFDALTSSIRASVAAGLEFNETIETSELAIASLITAQATLVDQTGRELQGREALNAALELSVEQVKELRVAGIQTAATTTELVDAFQQAVGAGVAAGLTLDEIRQVTIRIAQAAGALGVPYRQLNEEIRSILSGTIDQNTRIAKALGLTNEQVRLAREQNRLAEFLLEKFEAFGVAGEKLTRTFAGVKSNIAEALQLFAGEAVEPLFDRFRIAANRALGEAFDLDEAQISGTLQGLVRTARGIFARIGDLLARSIEKAVEGAQELSAWLEENREEVERILEETGDLVEAIGRVSTTMAEIVAATAQWAVEAGVVRQTFATIADVLDFIARNPLIAGGLLAAALGGVGAGFVALVGAGAAKVIGFTAAVTALAAAIDAVVESEAERIRKNSELLDQERELLQAEADRTRQAAELAAELKRLQGVRDDATAAAAERERAESRIGELERELIGLSPSYARVLREAKDGHEDVAAAVREEIEARKDLLETQIANAAQAVETARQALQDQEEAVAFVRRLPVLGFVDKIFLGDRSIEEARAELHGSVTALRELQETYVALARALAGEGGATPVPPDATGADALAAMKGQAKLALAEVKAALGEQERALQEAFRTHEIGIREFYDQLAEAQTAAIDRQIAIQRGLLDAATEQNERAAIEGQIVKLQDERAQAEADAIEKREKALKKLTEAVASVEIRLLQATGRGAEARRRAVEQEFAELVSQLEAEADEAGLAIVRRLIAVEAARARLDSLVDAVGQAQARLRAQVEEIELRAQSGAITELEARRELAAAYRVVRREIGRMLPQLRRVAEVTGDPEALARVQRLQTEFIRLGFEVSRLEDQLFELKRGAIDATTKALEELFTTGIREADNLAQAFANMAASIVASLQRIIAEMLAVRIVQASLNLFSGGGLVRPNVRGTGELGIAAASGGLIRGPGGPTDDRILARLSAGEYVIRAAAVKHWGADFFAALNRGPGRTRVRSPGDLFPGYATGGLVRNPAAARGDQLDVRGRVDVGLEEGLVLRELREPTGTRGLLRIVSQNQKQFRGALGLG